MQDGSAFENHIKERLIGFFIDGGDSWHATLIGATAVVWWFNLLQVVVCGVKFFIFGKMHDEF